ncbi:pentapeptide repeat-containing protein [Corynebacterium sp.]|uniref:pentapeptide repeat-containing protein n=1 Tax=Corynebacterium sp. TaxID=1720 RepID=UPI0025BD0181|nr:pentapeptide repeat-containing protein [Corynebacterium sp.]
MPARGRRITAPRLTAVRLPELTDATEDDLHGTDHYEALRFTGTDLGERDLTGADFVDCEFRDVQAGEARLRATRFSESRFERLTAPSLSAARSGWSDVHLTDSRLGAAELCDADLRAVQVRDSRLMFVNLRSARLRDVSFSGCTIDELDLTDARADRVAFDNCTVQTLRLDHAVLGDVDLRGLELAGVSGVETMRGAAISTTQAVDLAPLFARHLGVTVVD